jgi:predicted acyl esterase
MALGADLTMMTPDGVPLASRTWTPAGSGPWPVLLMRQPYGLAIASTVTYAHPSWYARQGFLVVVQDVRGRGDSGGAFGGFSQEGPDGAAAVRWARNLPGSNGKVGTYGFSYQGLSQFLNDGDGACLPDCLVPALCGLDERLHWASEGGAHWWSLGLGWALQLAAEGCRRRQDRVAWLEIRRSLESGAYLRDGLSLLERHDPAGMGLSWLRCDPERPELWRRHPVAEALLQRPMLLLAGWHDPQLRGVLDLHRLALAAGGQPELRIGAWSHLDWQGGIDSLQVEFLRRHLQAPLPNPGSQPPALPPPQSPAPAQPASGRAPAAARLALQCIRTGSWQTQAPLPEALARQGWRLASSGLAAIRSDEGRLLAATQDRDQSRGQDQDQVHDHDHNSVTLVHDPWRPTPSRGGHLGPEPGVVERQDLDQRSEVACFTAAALAAPLRLLGTPRLRLGAWADQPGFDLWACLSVLTSTGAVQQLCTGGLRLRGERARAQQERRLELQPLDATLQCGERLRLCLAPAAWPAFAVNPGDGSMPQGGVGLQHRVITIELALNGSLFWLDPLFGAN